MFYLLAYLLYKFVEPVAAVLQIVRQLAEKKRKELRKVYPGLTCFRDGVRQIPIESIPGVLESGWKSTPEK